jgi:hypothetical protein
MSLQIVKVLYQKSLDSVALRFRVLFHLVSIERSTLTYCGGQR